MMRRLVSILAGLLLLCSCSVTRVVPSEQTLTPAEYIARYSDTAVREMESSGVPASITLAQGCLETGYGNSYLARKGNNHFGIKCHDWTGATIQKDGKCFRRYKNADDSFRDHSDFLRTQKRYASLFDLETTDYKGWAYGLQKAGYATSPTYAERLIRIIEENDLARFDQMDQKAKKKKNR